MQQSASQGQVPAGLHVGIIMDGNGRWATSRGRLRVSGHRDGARAARRVVEAAPRLGIGVLTLFAFSADNWRRPRAEVAALMRLFREYLREETDRCIRNGVRLEVVGRRDRLHESLRRTVEEAERAAGGGTRLLLRIAIDYSARDAILRAAQCLRDGTVPSRESFTRLLAIVDHATPVPELDLLIRTGGERRLSDFLLWEAAYAELVFSDTMWPDFGADGLAAAVGEFAGRQRRFGGLAGVAAG
ncbi:MAG: di-trans,poly-cis-decaprenylcistransferase [Gemmatimonadales bacterium]|nr:di-trans,poly-cis-decaprenylcistransferase [Gemmatimonadales bacterium]MBA3554910.1 di-trans,poly-cis-decaprenylcistransferase [Gemmatimonadales bacterium]